MAQFFALTPLNAANFESGAAGDGQVLTADGAGNAAWEDAAGGGASFAYDGATFTPGAFVANSGGRGVSIELTLGGASITSGVLHTWVGVTEYANFGTLPFATANSQIYGIDPASLPILTPYQQPINYYASSLLVVSNGTTATFTITIGNDGAVALDEYVFILLPSGGIDISDAISIPGYVA